MNLDHRLAKQPGEGLPGLRLWLFGVFGRHLAGTNSIKNPFPFVKHSGIGQICAQFVQRQTAFIGACGVTVATVLAKERIKLRAERCIVGSQRHRQKKNHDDRYKTLECIGGTHEHG